MPPTANFTHLPGSSEPHQRGEVGRELQAMLVELVDTVAERVVVIGVSPDGQSGTVTSESPLRGVERDEHEKQLRMIRARFHEEGRH